MLTRNMYPVCAKTFQHFCESNKKFGVLYKKLNPQLFDVTLRDGLQGLTKEQQKQFTFVEKINLYHKIMFIQKPTNIEFGSVVSETVLPIFKDTFRFASYIYQQYSENDHDKEKTSYYVVVPNRLKLVEALKNTNITNFSFITP
jgi:isopropylmalate/homocitrate/citramalate synthase